VRGEKKKKSPVPIGAAANKLKPSSNGEETTRGRPPFYGGTHTSQHFDWLRGTKKKETAFWAHKSKPHNEECARREPTTLRTASY